MLRRDPPVTPPAPAPAASAPTRIALLDGLAVGDVVEGWPVVRIFVSRSHTDQPQLSVELEKDRVGFTIWIARKTAVVNPPVATERYALTYGDPRPLGATIAKSTYDGAMAALAARIRRTEDVVDVPAGL